MSLITLAEYKAFIEVTGSTKDAYYQMIIDAADAFLKQQVQQNLQSQVITAEYHAGRNRNFIIANERPVQSIQQLYYDPEGRYGQLSGSFDPVTSLQTLGTDYILKVDQTNGTSRSGIIYLLGGQGVARRERKFGNLNPQIMPTFGTFKLNYTAGFVTIPNDLKWATKALARALQLASKNAGMITKMESTKYYEYQLGELVNKVVGLENLIAKYRGLGMSIY